MLHFLCNLYLDTAGDEQGDESVSKKMKKKEIVEELSERAFTTRKQTEAIIESLIQIIGREAVNGFTIPGFCAFSVIDRKARKGRNPHTGKTIDIPAKKVLKVRPLSRIKHSATAWLPSVPETPAEDRDTIPVEDERSEKETFLISCPHCDKKLECNADMCGQVAECPFCMQTMTVPSLDDISVEPEPSDVASSYVLFSCPTCKQAIEEPNKNIGTRMKCPVCGTSVIVPETTELTSATDTNVGAQEDVLGSTIRIDLPTGNDF